MSLFLLKYSSKYPESVLNTETRTMLRCPGPSAVGDRE